jgi:predicted RecA/RadA family phage recombinase
MATNVKNYGNTGTAIAPVGGVTSGTPLVVGGAFVLPTTSAVAGATFSWTREGHWYLTKVAGFAPDALAAAYWDATSEHVEGADAADNRRIGVFAKAAANGAVVCYVIPDGVSFGAGDTDLEEVAAEAAVNTVHSTGDGSDHADVATNTAELAAAVAQTDGGAGNAGKLIELDANGDLDGLRDDVLTEADSDLIENSTVEATFQEGTGTRYVGLSLPAGWWQKGSWVHVKALVFVPTHNGGTHTTRLRIMEDETDPAGVGLADVLHASTALSAANDYIQVDFIVRCSATGAPATAKLQIDGRTWEVAAGAAEATDIKQAQVGTNFDTTAATFLGFTGQNSAAHADDEMQLLAWSAEAHQ